MENGDVSQHTSSGSGETSEQRRCWVCYYHDGYQGNGDWISPCKCRGSSKWVHEDCLKYWMYEKMKHKFNDDLFCPICYTQYIIVYDEDNYFVRVLNSLDKTADRLSPFLASGVVVCSIYWSAVVYGGLTIIQVLDGKQAVTIMESTNQILLFLVLPLIPLSLILSKSIDWDETLLLFVQRFTLQLPLLRTIMPSFLCEPVITSTSIIQFNSNIKKTTTICTALLLPTTATVVGNLFFGKSSYSGLKKTLLGGLIYFAVKGAFRIYQRQHNAMKERTRKVIDCPKTEEKN